MKKSTKSTKPTPATRTSAKQKFQEYRTKAMQFIQSLRYPYEHPGVLSAWL